MIFRFVLLFMVWVLGGFWAIRSAYRLGGADAGWLATGSVLLLWAAITTLAEVRLLAREMLRKDVQHVLHPKRHHGSDE